MEKQCSKCKRVLPSTEFYKNKSKVDGLATECKKCDSERGKAYHANHKKQASEYHRKWHKENRAKKLGMDREHYVNNREARMKNAREWTANNRKRKAENGRRYREEEREKAIAHGAVTYAIKMNDLPPAWTMVCSCCEEAQSRYWHHHEGYSEANRLNVVPVCSECHGIEHREKI